MKTIKKKLGDLTFKEYENNENIVDLSIFSDPFITKEEMKEILDQEIEIKVEE